MTTIALIDAVFFLASGAALWIVTLNRQGALALRVKRPLLLGLILFTTIYSLSLFIEWADISNKFEKFEDIIGALLPMWWAFFLYSFVQETSAIDLQKSEQKYSKQHAEFQAIFSSITDAIVFTDLNRQILMINPAFKSNFGYGLEEVAGKTTQLIYANPDEYHNQGKLRYHKSSTIDMPVYEIEYRRKDGSIFPSETLGGPVKDSNGDTIGFLGVIRDISDRKEAEKEKAQLEEQWRQSQKLEAIGTLAGGIAHDFNNILSVILGYTDLAKVDAPPGSNYSDDLDKVLEAGYRAKDLVQQILAFSRQAQIEKVSLKPQAIIKEALRMLRASIPTTIEVRASIDPDCGVIDADPTQFHQIVMNLCTNAFHAMEEKGGILEVVLRVADSVPLELKEGKSNAGDGFLEFSISDTGRGIGPEFIDKIFDPFFTTKEKGKGTGMGLAITYGIVKEYGGTITVDSQLGKGTTFKIYLPRGKAETVLEKPEVADAPKGSERILFVDDEELLIKLGKDMLERFGYHVTAKLRSFEALEAFQNQPDKFDLVITDQTMPGMTGLDMARRMLQIRPDIPVILCTGHSTLVDENVSKAQGIKGFALKPVGMKDMSRLIRQILDGDETVKQII